MGAARKIGPRKSNLTQIKLNDGKPAMRWRFDQSRAGKTCMRRRACPTIAIVRGLTTTVSKYVNGAQRFSPAVEATIKQVIETLGYRSNPLAQSMIT
ncbi:MAG: transcriptional regulator, LacI family, partial [Massilia sp.]|nr:transcriptional regulator, LacI family [Massilia sp.]